MLGDVHTICGYMIAKYLFEVNLSKNAPHSNLILPQSLLHLSSNNTNNPLSSSLTSTQSSASSLSSASNNHMNKAIHFTFQNGTLKQIRNALKKKVKQQGKASLFRAIIRYIRRNLFSPRRWLRFLRGLTLEQKYLLCGMVLSNLPDLDVLLTPLMGGFHQFHRTLTHSIYGNAVIVPIAGYGAFRFLGLKGGHALRHCIKLALLCVSSHLVTDYITNYGTALFYPFSKRTYTFGVITVLDFTTVLFFYIMLTISRHNWMRQSNVMKLGIVAFIALMIWKRACLCEVYSKQFHFMERQRKGHCKIWIQPNNFRNGKFSVMKYNPKTDYVQELKSIKVSSYLSVIHYLGELLHIKGNDMRRVKMSDALGAFQGMCAPKEFFPSLQRTNHDLLKQIVKSSLPTVSLMTLYHLTYLAMYMWRSVKT